MATYDRISGVRITLPETFVSTPEMRATPRTRGGMAPLVPPILTDSDSEAQTLAAALAAQELQLVDEIEMKPDPMQPVTTRAAAVPASEAARSALLDVPVRTNENAILLVEHDGEFSWVLPSGEPIVSPPLRRGPVLEPGSKTIRFQFTLEGEPSLDSSARRRGLLGDLVLDRVKAWVFKFVAVIAVGQIMKFLERNVSRGLITMVGDDPASWKLGEGNVIPNLPKDRPARILLFIHGTFSSTAGGFGALCGTPWGRALLAGMRHNYDAVIGFDHATLSEDPLANATELFDILNQQSWSFPPIIDAVAHSRGGLVLRSLTEILLPGSNFHPVMDRAVFVGCTNAGTQLANAEHWGQFADFYTNAAVCASRLLQTIPQATAVATVLKELVQGVGALVKYMASTAVDQNAVPGLAAMSPGSEFITRLNETQPGQPTPANTHYYVVTSEFRPELIGEQAMPPEFPKRLALAIADGLADRILGEANDLVVNISSMPAIDSGGFIKDTFTFGQTSKVYHTTYFHRPEVTNAIARWLQLAAPGAAAMPSLPCAMAAGDEIPANIDTDVIVVPADATLDHVQRMVRTSDPAYVVLERPRQGHTRRYVLQPSELMKTAAAPDQPVSRVLRLRESGCLPAETARGSKIPSKIGNIRGPRVVVHQDRTIGVAPEVTTFEEPLGQMATTAAGHTGDVAERSLRRRAMPTFTLSAPLNQRISKISSPDLQHYYFNASMEDEVVLKHTATIEVDVSTELLAQVAGKLNASSLSNVDPTKKLIVQVIPRSQFEVKGDDRLEFDPPPQGEIKRIFFDVVGTDEGEGEVWIVVRQAQIGIATMSLKPRVVAARSTKPARTAARAQTVDAPTVPPMSMLRISERTNGNETRYDYELQAIDLNIMDLAISDAIQNRVDFIGSIYKAIEGFWAASKNSALAFETKLKSYGASLAVQLIPEKLRRTLWDNRAILRKIVVLSTEPFVPWELLLIDNPDESNDPDARFLGEMGLVRWIYNVPWAKTRIEVRADRAFYVTPDYPIPTLHLTETLKEGIFLKSMFGAKEIAADSLSLQAELKGPGAIDLLHFAGHGSAQFGASGLSQLLLAGTVANGQYVYDFLDDRTVRFVGKLASPDGNRPLVVLNACQAGRVTQQLTALGGFAEAFINAGAGAFVSSLWSVGDEPARVFTQELYAQLNNGMELAESVIAARAKARAEGDATWLAYTVYGNPFCKLAFQPANSQKVNQEPHTFELVDK